MKAYIGTKVVQAKPENRRGTKAGDPAMEEGYKVVYEDGYESWSPKAVFERCYREITSAETVLVRTGD